MSERGREEIEGESEGRRRERREGQREGTRDGERDGWLERRRVNILAGTPASMDSQLTFAIPPMMLIDKRLS